MAKGKGRGRPRNQGKRTASGRISRAGKVVKGSIGTRLAHARPLLGADDRTRLEMLVMSSPAALLAAGEIEESATFTAAEVLEWEREKLFTKAEAAMNAVQRRDPIGRAWHEGLLDGQGVDPEVLRDIGRQFGFLYWHEYRSVDATVGGYSDMIALGSVRLSAAGKDTLGHLFKIYSQIIDDMGRPVRTALDRLCVNDMWFAEGPDWLDRMINTQRLQHDIAISGLAGELARKDDAETMMLAVRGLVALAKGGASSGVRYNAEKPLIAEVGSASVYVDEAPEMALDAEFFDDRGFMLPLDEIRAIVLARLTGEEQAA